MDQWQHDHALLLWKNKGFSFETIGDGLMVQRLLDTISCLLCSVAIDDIFFISECGL